MLGLPVRQSDRLILKGGIGEHRYSLLQMSPLFHVAMEQNLFKMFQLLPLLPFFPLALMCFLCFQFVLLLFFALVNSSGLT